MSGAFAVACLEERGVLPAAVACDDPGEGGVGGTYSRYRIGTARESVCGNRMPMALSVAGT